MKLLSQTLPQARQLVRQGGWFGPSLIVSVVALEFFGRQSANDFYDSVGAAALVLLVALVSIRHRALPLSWVTYLGRQVHFVARYADRFKLEFGPDLRGQPPIPRKLPRTLHWALLALVLWSGGALAVWHFLPFSWRSYAIQGSYTLYLVGMIGLWGVLFAGLLGGIYFPFMLFNYLTPRAILNTGDPKISRPQLAFLSIYSTLIVSAWYFLPLWIVPLISVAGLGAASMIAVWPRRPDVQFIWRAEGSVRVYSISTPQLLWIVTAVVVLLLTATTFTAAGGRILGQSRFDTDMPITGMLGSVVGWLTPGILVSGSIFVYLLWKHNPSRPCRRSLHVGGDLAAAVRPQVIRALAKWEWDAHFDPRPASEVDVRVHLVESTASQAAEFDPVWPLRLSLEDLKSESVRERLERRDEIQKRRLLLRGLEKIFKHAKRRQHPGGSGYWLAPHLWFMPGLARDEMDEERDDAAFLTQTVGPPFHDVLHRHVRQYFYHMLRALQIDLIFVEDGIDFRKLKRVMRVMFEVYDKSAGKRRADEVQFQGLPKVKVLIHNFQLDEPFKSETYPEPRFEDLGRARILHVFHDRGEHEEYVDPPFDFSFTPVPLYA